MSGCHIEFGDFPDTRLPVWACGYSEDKYGFSVEISVASVQQSFRWIPKGTFRMGSPRDEHGRYSILEDPHEVQLSRGFWLADTACTQGFWRAVMGNNPAINDISSEHPIENVSWEEVQIFLERINSAIWGANARLPSEAMWEYACRAGSGDRYSYGNDLSPKNCNFDSRPHGGRRESTVPVKNYPPNELGLFQMHGNVYEWCSDVFNRSLGADSQVDPEYRTGHLNNYRVVKGGSWFSTHRECRSASRSWLYARNSSGSVGFRILMPR